MSPALSSILLLLACSLSLAACLACSLSLFWFRRELRRLRHAPPARETDPKLLGELASEVERLKARFEEEPARGENVKEWAGADSSAVHLNRRGQVLRLYRRGDSLAHIAASLGLSTGEVALIVKVQEMAPPGE